MPDKKRRTYTAGVVGCGRIGCGFDDDPGRGYVSTHAGAYVRTPGVKLIALSDLDTTRMDRYARKFRVPGRYRDYRQMLAREKLDLLSVCTGTQTHRKIVEEAAEAGVKAIFCEKPIAESLGAADQMIRRCARRGVLLMVDHQRRFDPFHQAAAAFLRRGTLGSIQQVTCYYTAGVANTGSHLFDLLRFFFGETAWVQGAFSQNPSPDSRDPNIDGWLRFENGPLVTIQACDVRHYTIFEMNILGTQGRLRLTSHGFDAQLEKAQRSRHFHGYRELHPARLPINRSGPQEFMLQGVRHLLDCLEGKTKPLCSGEDGKKALELVCALTKSARAGGRHIFLPLHEGRSHF